jgi:hypothetical protein
MVLNFCNRRLISIVLPLALLMSACSSVPNNVNDIFEQNSLVVTVVRSGTLESCPNSTVGEIADAYFSDPQWSDFTTTNGNTVVELTGGMTYNNLPAEALIQFTVHQIAGTFEGVYFSLNGTSQSLTLMTELFDQMCAAA